MIKPGSEGYFTLLQCQIYCYYLQVTISLTPGRDRTGEILTSMRQLHQYKDTKNITYNLFFDQIQSNGPDTKVQ